MSGRPVVRLSGCSAGGELFAPGRHQRLGLGMHLGRSTPLCPARLLAPLLSCLILASPPVVFAQGRTTILISLDKWSNYKLTSVTDGVLFDMNGDGVAERVSWVATDSNVAFLAIDRDGDGLITSGWELVGEQTVSGARNGFHALQLLTLASNGGVVRGSVSADDALLEELLLWSDTNHNGISEPSELRRASEPLSAIGLGYQPIREDDHFGNKFIFRGWAHLRTAPGKNNPETAEEDVQRTIAIWNVGLVTKQ